MEEGETAEKNREVGEGRWAVGGETAKKIGSREKNEDGIFYLFLSPLSRSLSNSFSSEW